MTNTIRVEDMQPIARGAAMLGTGGGGDPHLGRLLAEAALREHGDVELVALADLPDDAVVVPVAMMGAPTVMVEKLPTVEQLEGAVRSICTYLGVTPTHIGCMEAGGVNSTLPVVAAAKLGLPLLDADGMGRAFPELQMVLPTLVGARATPMSITDEKGNSGVLDTVDNHWAERIARSVTIDMGCSAMVSLYVMTGAVAKAGMVPATLSLCRELGELAAPGHAGAVSAVVERLGGRQVFVGKVVDVQRRTVTGFARGDAEIQGLDECAGSTGRLRFQNEHIIVEVDDELQVTAPDLIIVLDAETGEPITTEGMRFGHRVRVIAAPCDERWHSPEGIALVGPRYFGYDTDPLRWHGKAGDA